MSLTHAGVERVQITLRSGVPPSIVCTVTESKPVSFNYIAVRLNDQPLPAGSVCRIVAIDGRGGSGKTLLAERLSRSLEGVPIIHTDDFASWDEPLEWWPRFLDAVLRPLVVGLPARFRRYDWDRGNLGDWVETPASPMLVIEGVGSCRLAFGPYLSGAIWVEAPRELRLARGLARDGADMLGHWEQWMAEEDAYVNRERPDLRADYVISGAPSIALDAESEVEVLREGVG